MKLKFLVLGSKGMLGYAVTEYLKQKGHDVTPLSRSEFDIANDPLNNLNKYLHGIDTVINCAGVIKPRIKDLSVLEVLKVNSVFPRNLAMLCKKSGIKCIHITTDCVYSGSKGKYDEEDLFDADDIYGMSKNAGEPSGCMVLRTSIIGEEKDSRRSLLEWAKSQSDNEVKGFTNHRWNGVTTLYLAEIIESILLNGRYEEGTFHIFSPDPVDKYQLLGIFDNVYNLNLKITPFEAEVSCDRSLSSRYKLSGELCRSNIRDQVSKMKNFFSDLNNSSYNKVI